MNPELHRDTLPSSQLRKAKSTAVRVGRDDCVRVFCRTLPTWDDTARRLLVRERAFAARQRAKAIATPAVIYLPSGSQSQILPPPVVLMPTPAPLTIKRQNSTTARLLQAAMHIQRRKLEWVA